MNLCTLRFIYIKRCLVWCIRNMGHPKGLSTKPAESKFSHCFEIPFCLYSIGRYVGQPCTAFCGVGDGLR